MPTFGVYIKSHCEAPDYENIVEAESKKEALDKIWGNGQGWLENEWSKEDVAQHIELIN